MCEERQLSGSAQRAVRRYNWFSNLAGCFGITGSLLLPVGLFGQPTEMPDGWFKCVYVVPFVAVVAWLVYRDWRLRRGWPCPQCSARLRMEREPPSLRGNFLFTCRGCGSRWDSGLTHYRERHPSDSGG